jgi:hypothetical protein
MARNLYEKWRDKLLNNPVIAALVLAVTAIGAIVVIAEPVGKLLLPDTLVTQVPVVPSTPQAPPPPSAVPEVPAATGAGTSGADPSKTAQAPPQQKPAASSDVEMPELVKTSTISHSCEGACDVAAIFFAVASNVPGTVTGIPSVDQRIGVDKCKALHMRAVKIMHPWSASGGSYGTRHWVVLCAAPPGQ